MAHAGATLAIRGTTPLKKAPTPSSLKIRCITSCGFRCLSPVIVVVVVVVVAGVAAVAKKQRGNLMALSDRQALS